MRDNEQILYNYILVKTFVFITKCKNSKGTQGSSRLFLLSYKET